MSKDYNNPELNRTMFGPEQGQYKRSSSPNQNYQQSPQNSSMYQFNSSQLGQDYHSEPQDSYYDSYSMAAYGGINPMLPVESQRTPHGDTLLVGDYGSERELQNSDLNFASTSSAHRVEYPNTPDAWQLQQNGIMPPMGVGQGQAVPGNHLGAKMATPLVKSESSNEDIFHYLEDSRSESQPQVQKSNTQKTKGKSAHNVIEQRYRNKINDKFTALQYSVPTLRVVAMKKGKADVDDDEDGEDGDSSDDFDFDDSLEGLEPAKKLNKGTILTKTVEYIKFLENKNRRMKMEHQQLIERAQMLGQKLDDDLRSPDPGS